MKKLSVLLPCFALLVCFAVCTPLMAQDMEKSMPLNRHVGPYAEANLGYTFAWVSGGIAGNDRGVQELSAEKGSAESFRRLFP